MDFWTTMAANLPSTIFALSALVAAIATWYKQCNIEDNVQKIELATNSMQKKMLASSKAEGRELGKLEERADPQEKKAN